MKKIRFYILSLLFLLSIGVSISAQETQKWTNRSAKKWLTKHEWAGGLSLVTHPSVNALEFAQQYHLNKAYWDAAFLFLKEHDLNRIEKGKYPIDGENVFASVTEDPSKDFDKTNWESHRKYVDLQYVINGEEILGMSPSAKAKVIKEYDEKKDVANYEIAGTLMPSQPSAFFLFFPSDAHRPNITPGGNKVVKKIVIKVRYASQN